jgi:hypothetical protein
MAGFGGAGTGAAIGAGFDSFLKTYLGITQYKDSQKWNNQMRMYEVLKDQMHDDNIPMSKKVSIARNIEDLFKIKDNRYSDQLLGLLNEDVATGETQTASTTPNRELATADAQDLITQVGGEAPNLQYNKNVTVKRGNLSDREFATINQNRNQIRMAKLDADLKRQAVLDYGYQKGEDGTDAYGNTWQVYANPNNPDKTIYIPFGTAKDDKGNILTKPTSSLTPKSTEERRIAAEQTKGELGTFERAVRAQNPTWTDEQVKVEAADRWSKKQEAITTGIVQRTTAGGVPPTQNQITGNEQSKQDKLDKDNDAYAEASAAIVSTTNEYQIAENDRKTAFDNNVDVQRQISDLEQQRRAAVLDEDEDKVKDIDRQLTPLRQQSRDFEKQIRAAENAKRDADRRSELARKKREVLGARITKNGGTFASSTTTPTNTGSATATVDDSNPTYADPRVGELIKKTRAKNPDKTKDMTDTQIFDYLVSKGIIKRN